MPERLPIAPELLALLDRHALGFDLLLELAAGRGVAVEVCARCASPSCGKLALHGPPATTRAVTVSLHLCLSGAVARA